MAEALANDPAAILDELTQLGLSMARDLHARQAQAETAAEAAQLAEAFHKISRSVRQSLALKARLARTERQDRLPAARDAQDLRTLNRTRVREGCARLIWTEAEGDEADDLEHRLDTLLDTADLTDDDLAPVAARIAAIARTLGLKTPPAEANPRPDRPASADGQPEKVIFEWRLVEPAQDPPLKGEGDREAVEGVEAHSALPPAAGETPDAGGLNPLSPSGTAPPEGEQPRRILRGLPGEYPPWDAYIDSA